MLVTTNCENCNKEFEFEKPKPSSLNKRACSKECSYKFKKYDVNNFELLGQIGPKTIEIDKIDEEFLVNLKIELDDEYGGEEEELEFET